MIIALLFALVVGVVLFAFKSWLVMLTWGMAVENVDVFSNLSTFSFEESLYVTLFATVLFAFTFASSSKSDS